MFKKTLVLLPIILFPMLITAQTAKENSELVFQKRVLHASFGTAILTASITGYYDHRIFNHNSKSAITTYLRAGLGTYSDIGSNDGSFLLLQTIWLTGRSVSHLEGGLGVAFIQENKGTATSTNLKPAVLVGYRYQKPETKLMFRTGIGYPEAFYFGAGLAF